MARKAKKKIAKPKSMKGHNGKAPNGLTPADNVRHHHAVLTRAQKKLDDAKALLRKAEKSAVADGIVMRDYREAISNEKKSEKDLFTRHNNVKHYMQALGVSYHRNMNFLGGVKTPDSSPEAVEKRASDLGYDDGLAGRPINETYDPGTPAGQRYLAGYKDGNNELGKSSFRGKETKPKNDEPKSVPPKPWSPFGSNGESPQS
jgi:hypothetical protein